MPDPRITDEVIPGGIPGAAAPPAEEIPAAPPGEGAPPAEAAAVGGSIISASADDAPELAGLSVGDPITLTVTEISEDGKTYTLTPAAEELPPIEGGLGPGGGRGAVAEELIGGAGGA